MKRIKIPTHPDFLSDFMHLNEGQQLVYFGYLSGFNLMLTGGGGVGKSHFIRFLKKYHDDVVLTASTGIAGVNINGQTMDSFMGFSKRTRTIEDAVSIKQHHVISRLKQVETILVDESSMLRIDRFEMLDARLRKARKDDRPFGGVQLILVSDFMQLAPVLKEDTDEGRQFIELYGDKRFLFESELFSKANFEPYLLHEYIRNGNPEERRILRNMRMGNKLPEVVSYINQHATGELVTEDSIVICKTNKKVKDLNDAALAKLPGEATQYKAKIDGDYPRELFPTEDSISLKNGCRVMLTMNDTESGFMNGDLGTVKSLSSESITVLLDRGGIVTVERNEWVNSEMVAGENELKEHAKGSFFQLPVRLGYAITAHKCQGLTLDSAIADLYGWFNADGMTYVITSRVKSFSGLKLVKPLHISDIWVNPKAASFTTYTSKESLSRNANRLLSMQIHLKSHGIKCA